ncbi:MAG: SRPBCC domain-containing protein [Microthrixaceae bacterium]
MDPSVDSTDPFDLSGMVVEVAHTFDSPIGRVWALLTDVERMAGLGPEHHAAAWIARPGGQHPTSGMGPVVGDRFAGRNRRGEFEWEVTCHITEWQPPRRCTWTVLDPAQPSSTWTYELSEDAAGTCVTQTFRHGPGPSFVRVAVERDPAGAESVVAGRSDMLRTDMIGTLRAAERLLVDDEPS